MRTDDPASAREHLEALTLLAPTLDDAARESAGSALEDAAELRADLDR
ncbi:hypothetical protein [Cellulosimicrobium sp. Marseille-Q8652]